MSYGKLTTRYEVGDEGFVEEDFKLKRFELALEGLLCPL